MADSGDVAQGRGKDDGGGLRQLDVNVHSGELVAEAKAALKRAQRGGLSQREGCSEVGAWRWASRRGAVPVGVVMGHNPSGLFTAQQDL